jgi:hypothetical protein
MENSLFTYGLNLFEVVLYDGSVVNLIASSTEHARRLISAVTNTNIESICQKETLFL